MPEADELEQLADPLAAVALAACRRTAGRTRRSGARSCSGTGCRPGRPCRCRACWAASASRPCRRRRSSRRSGGRSRRRGAAPSSCRSRTGRAATRTRPARGEVDPVERDHGPEDPPQSARARGRPSARSCREHGARRRPRPISRSESIAAQVMPKLSSETAAAGYACVSLDVLDVGREGVKAARFAIVNSPITIASVRNAAAERRGADVRQDHAPSVVAQPAPRLLRRLGQRVHVDRAEAGVEREEHVREREDHVRGDEEAVRLRRRTSSARPVHVEQADHQHDRRDDERQEREERRSPAATAAAAGAPR